MKCRKGQVGIIGAVFLFITFIVIWFIWLGSFLNEIGKNAIESYGATGIEAMFYSNLNLVIFVCLILGVSAWMYFARAA